MASEGASSGRYWIVELGEVHRGRQEVCARASQASMIHLVRRFRPPTPRHHCHRLRPGEQTKPISLLLWEINEVLTFPASGWLSCIFRVSRRRRVEDREPCRHQLASPHRSAFSRKQARRQLSQGKTSRRLNGVVDSLGQGLLKRAGGGTLTWNFRPGPELQPGMAQELRAAAGRLHGAACNPVAPGLEACTLGRDLICSRFSFDRLSAISP